MQRLLRPLERFLGSAYCARLGQHLWLPAFVLILHLLLTLHLLEVSGSFFAGSEGGLSYTSVLVRCMFRSLLWASLAWWLAACPRGAKGRSLVSGFVVGFLSVLHFFESFLITTYGVGYSHPIIIAIAGTNPQEASEYWTSTFSFSPFLRPLLELLLTLAASWGVKWVARWVPRMATAGLALATLLTTGLHAAVVIPSTYSWVMNFGTAFDQTISPMDRLVWNSIGFAHETYLIRQGASKMRQLDLGKLEVAPSPYGPMNVVVIIGETLRRDQMHCYGFPLENTPHLDSLIAQGLVIPFSDVVSPGTNTVESLTHVLTYKQFADSQPWHSYPALPYVLSQAGYRTAWTSNQESTGAIVQPLNSLASLADRVKYVHARSIDGDRDARAANYDEDALKWLSDMQQTGTERFVQFVHLEGSHPLYSKRFPQSYARFQPDQMPERLNAEQRQTLADYVNSVYYNDYVVSEIIKRYSQQASLVLYFSDHGEVLYDDPEHPDFAGHGRTKPCAEVPFLVYLSPKLRQQAPQLVAAMEAAKDRPILNDLFTHSLLGLLGIKTKYSDPKLEFFGPHYDAQRPRILTGWGKELHF